MRRRYEILLTATILIIVDINCFMERIYEKAMECY